MTSTKKYRIRLTTDEQRELKTLVSRGRTAAYKQTHARILLMSDESRPDGGMTDADISSVIGVDESTHTHRGPQLVVGFPHRTRGTSQRVLADRSLTHFHPGQRSEHSGNLSYRNAHPIVEHVSRRHHSPPNPVAAGAVLVRPNIGMPATDLPAAGPAPAYLHPVRRHLRTPNRRNVCHVGNSHSLILESASASRTDLHRHRHLYDRLGDFIGRGRLAVAEQPHIRLAAGTLGLAASPALRERSRLALSPPRWDSASCFCNSKLTAFNSATCSCSPLTSAISSSRSAHRMPLGSHIAEV